MPEIPESAAQPQDRKSKKDAVEAAVAEANDQAATVEYDGVEYAVVPGFQDIEFLEDIDRLNRGNIVVIPGLLRRVIGDDAYAAIKDKYRDPATGRTPKEPLFELFYKIDASLGE